MAGALDLLRARAHAALARAPGRLGDRLRGVNEALGRPLADADELADRRAFAAGTAGDAAPASAGAATGTRATPPAAPGAREQAPVIVYFMDRQQRDVGKLTAILEAAGIAYTATNLQEDPAAQYAVKRDSKGLRLPVVFVAGECLGGREHLVNAVSSGELAKKVFG